MGNAQLPVQEAPANKSSSIPKVIVPEPKQTRYQSQFSQDLSEQLTPEQLNTPLAILARELTQLSSSPRAKSFYEIFLPQVSIENWKEAHAAVGQFPRGSQGATALRMYRPETLYVIGELVGEDAAVYLKEIDQREDLEACLKGWTLSDPDAALAWMESELEPLARARLWNSHGYSLIDHNNEKWLPERLGNQYFGKLIRRQGIEVADRVYQRMAADVALEKDPGMAYLPLFAGAITDAKLREPFKNGSLARIARELPELTWGNRMSLFKRSFLPQITSENWLEAYLAITQFMEGTEESKRLRKCRPDACMMIGERAGKEAVVYFHNSDDPEGLEAGLKGWILKEPEAATAWLETEFTPLERAKIWNSHGEALFRKGSEEFVAKIMANDFFKKVIEYHGIEVAEKVYQRMAEDLTHGEQPNKAYLDEFDTLIAEAKLAQEAALEKNRVPTDP